MVVPNVAELDPQHSFSLTPAVKSVNAKLAQVPRTDDPIRNDLVSSFGQYKFRDTCECPQCKSCTASKKGIVKVRKGHISLSNSCCFEASALIKFP